MERFIQLFTWWISSDGKRQFAVVDKIGKHVDEKRPGGTYNIYKTVQIKLLEALTPNPIYYSVEDFWDLVDRGRLVEYIPGETKVDVAKEGQMTSKPVDWRNPDNDIDNAKRTAA